MASRDRWIWHLWLSRNHLCQNNSSDLCIETQQKQRDIWSPHVSKLSKCRKTLDAVPQGDHETVGSIALVALLQSALSMHQQQTLHQNSTKARGLLVSSHTSPNNLHDCMTPSETFGPESFSLQAQALYAFFLLFSSLGPIRPSGGFSDLQKRQDFEGRAPRRHKTVGFGTASGQYVAS